jgi:DNA-binding transcriptional LysR family regulator
VPSLDWDKLRVFHAVAEAGSLTRAGESLSLSQSAVSRQISALEDNLNTVLFHRHARGLILTEQGEELFRTAHDIYGKVARAEGILKDNKDKPSGDLRVTASVGIGSTWLTPRLSEFIDIYPDIRLDLILEDRSLDLGMREADIAIRLQKATQPDLIQRPLFVGGYHIYASSKYLDTFGTPKTMADLREHKIILYGEHTELPYTFMNFIEAGGNPGGTPIEPVLRINSIYGILQAVESGIGIAALPDYIAFGNNRVVRILRDEEVPRMETFFVYPEELRNSKRVAVFRDFLLRKVKEWQF